MAKKQGSWEFKLFTSSHSPQNADIALTNIQAICQEWFLDKCSIDAIDLVTHPKLAKEYEIVAIPTLIRLKPLPVIKIIGNLSNREKTLAQLKLTPQGQF